MAYNSSGSKSFEYASKAAHSHIINDDEVKAYLQNCEIPVESINVELDPSLLYQITYPSENKIKYVIAVDGGYSTIPVKKTFPSALITFFQFGSLLLQIRDLEGLEKEPFIAPSDIRKLKEIERKKLVLPTKNVALNKGETFTYSVRKTIYEFFNRKESDGKLLLHTLEWFLFELYSASPLDSKTLSWCPSCKDPKVPLFRSTMNNDYTWACAKCSKEIFITDVFRLFEAVDEETGAGGILGYITNLIESFYIIDTIKSLIEIQHDFINEFMLIKDGPLSFIGNTANMHKPMRNLLNHLSMKYNVNLVGIEKSGAFVDHAKEIQDKLQPGQLFILSNKHIYSYILPGNPDSDEYATTAYYSGKMIFKSYEGKVYVLTLPLDDSNKLNRPEKSDFKNIDEILMNIDKLKCDIYEDALLPVAVANKLISLSNHPSSKILERFAKKTIS